MRRLISWLFSSRRQVAAPAPKLLVMDDSELDDLLLGGAELPMIDWDAAESRVARLDGGDHERDLWRRSLNAAWLDRLRAELKSPHIRWRTASVEGIAPADADLHSMITRVSEASFVRIHSGLSPAWDGHPIPPAAVVAVASTDDYYTLKATAYGVEGEFAASAGCYLRRPFPLVLLPTTVRWSVGATIAHELTHHALTGLSLPLWVEEGLTQTMEEVVLGQQTGFRVDREMLERHIAHWSESGLEGFWSGEAFSSAAEDDQELSYHLAELLARRLLADRRRDYLAFIQRCDSEDAGAAAAKSCLGATLAELVAGSLGPGDWVPGSNPQA